jgi:hypothetical protein
VSHKIDYEAKVGPGYTYKRVRFKRKNYGEIRTYDRDGKKLNIYWAKRKTDEKFHADESWAVDVDTVAALRPYNIAFIGILVEDGTKLLAPASLFSHSPESKDKGVVIRNYSKHIGAKGKLGALQYYVPERLFAIAKPPEEERVATLTKRMHISKTRA